MKKLLNKMTLCAVGALVSLGASQMSADVLVDRGLPTANLNNAAGSNRSNVSWAYGIDNNGSWLVGDTFTNTSSSTYFIDTIRLWTTGETTDASLWGGLTQVGSYTNISNSYVSSAAQYQGGSTYQVPNGNYSPITQLDFSVNLTLGAGQSFSFFLDGSRSTTPFIPFLHSSNADLSGSPQDGADNTMLWALLSNGTIESDNVGTWTSAGNGWDKASDVNVQVLGTVPDSGATIVLLGLALSGMSLLTARNKRR